MDAVKIQAVAVTWLYFCSHTHLPATFTLLNSWEAPAVLLFSYVISRMLYIKQKVTHHCKAIILQ